MKGSEQRLIKLSDAARERGQSLMVGIREWMDMGKNKLEFYGNLGKNGKKINIDKA